MKWQMATLVAAFCLWVTACPVAAHHSTAMYDNEHPVTVTGMVKKFDWTNPHAFVYLEVKDEKGNTVDWEVEMMSLNHLRSYGWTSKTVKPGDKVEPKHLIYEASLRVQTFRRMGEVQPVSTSFALPLKAGKRTIVWNIAVLGRGLFHTQSGSLIVTVVGGTTKGEISLEKHDPTEA